MRKELKDTVCQVFYSVYLLFCQVFSLRVLVKSSVACVCVCVCINALWENVKSLYSMFKTAATQEVGLH